MGYCYSVMDSSFRIQSHHYTDMMDHLIKWHNKMKATNCQLKWMDHDNALTLLEQGDLIEYFGLWLYDAKIDITTGDICDLVWGGEKIGDEYNMFEQIAPWVDDESYLNCQGEDGEMWRWYWRQGNLYQIEAEIHYPDPVEMGVRPTPTVLLNDELNAARVANGWESNEPAIDPAVQAFLTRPTPTESGSDTQYALNALRGKNASHG